MVQTLARNFSLRTVLTVTTGRLLTNPRNGQNGIEDLYDILGFMTDDSPTTHQLGRFAEECKPWLLRWYPELIACGVEGSLQSLDGWIERDKSNGDEGIRMWLTELKMLFQNLRDEYEITKIPRDDHEVKDPYDELVAMLGTDEGIIVLDSTGEIESQP